MGLKRLKNRRRNDQGSKWVRITIALLSTIGVIDTGSITFQRWGWLGALSCPGGVEGCNKVLNSPWGTILQGENIDIPLSFLGLISYLTILILSLFIFLPISTDLKNKLTHKSWWLLFAISCCMSVFSFVLVGLMLFKIKGFCFFCVLSAIISLLLLVLSIIGGNWEDRSDLFFRGFLLSLAVLLSSFIWLSAVDPINQLEITQTNGMPPSVQSISKPSQIKLAKHLTNKGIVMYSAYWCPHCHDQKEMFGKEATKELKIVECAKDGYQNQALLCESKGITGYPSWEINQSIESGVLSLKQLKEMSNYKNLK